MLSTKFIVFWDDGHGMETAGKRTPKFSDGTFMHENEFNRGVCDLLQIFAHNTDNMVGFLTSPGSDDNSLSSRSGFANEKIGEMYAMYGKDKIKSVFVSVHANAFKGVWGDWGGQELYYYPGSVEGKKLAESVHKEMIKGTPLIDRGVKAHVLHMTRVPVMPSILTESAFMDNLKEATLLKSWNFRLEVAKEIFTGVCNYFGIEANFPEIFNVCEESCEELKQKYIQLKIKVARYEIEMKNTIDNFKKLL